MEAFEFAREVQAGRAVANSEGINKRRTAIAVGLVVSAVAIGAAAAFL